MIISDLHTFQIHPVSCINT